MDYGKIFTENVLRLQKERGLTKQELATLVGVSGAFITELARGTANPTVKSLQAFSEGLGVPLPLLLKPVTSDEWQTILAVANAKQTVQDTKQLPEGFGVLANVVLPLHKIYVVEQWIKDGQKRLRTKKAE